MFNYKIVKKKEWNIMLTVLDDQLKSINNLLRK